jgi:hypothetical protein
MRSKTQRVLRFDTGAIRVFFQYLPFSKILQSFFHKTLESFSGEQSPRVARSVR